MTVDATAARATIARRRQDQAVHETPRTHTALRSIDHWDSEISQTMAIKSLRREEVAMPRLTLEYPTTSRARAPTLLSAASDHLDSLLVFCE